jgi:transposase InsO family protein
VWRQLKASGVRVGKRRVQRTMQREGIRGRGKRRFRVVTTDSKHALPIAPNLLARHFTVAAANTVWAGDMTYIPTAEGWLYLAVVLDLFSRRIVGWSMGAAITAELACRALDMAYYQRSPVPGLIFHSDRGSQYASRCYTDLLAGHGIKASMSRKGNCWDNACSETLFGSPKVERLHGMQFHNHRQAKDAVVEWMLWYNGARMHSTLKYISPAQLSTKLTLNTTPSQHDREGSTATRRKSKTSTLMRDAF